MLRADYFHSLNRAYAVDDVIEFFGTDVSVYGRIFSNAVEPNDAPKQSRGTKCVKDRWPAKKFSQQSTNGHGHERTDLIAGM